MSSTCENEQECKVAVAKPPLDFHSYGLVHLFQVVVQSNMVDELLDALDKDEKNHLRADYVMALKENDIKFLRHYFEEIFHKAIKHARTNKLLFTKFKCKMIVFFVKETNSKIIITPCGELRAPSNHASNTYFKHITSCNYCRLFYDMIKSKKKIDDLETRACKKYLLNKHFVKLVLDYTEIHVECYDRFKKEKVKIKDQIESKAVQEKLSIIAVKASKMYSIIVNDNIDMNNYNIDQLLSNKSVIDESNKFLAIVHQQGTQFLSKHDGFMKILLKFQFITLTCRKMYPKYHATIHRHKQGPLTPEDIKTVQTVFENEYQSANQIQGHRNAKRIRFVSNDIDRDKV